MRGTRLFIEAEVEQIVVLDDVLFGFQALFAGAFGLGFAAGLNKILKTNDLGTDEALLNVRVDGSGSFPGADAFADWPGAIFFAADGQKANVSGALKGAQEQRIRALKLVAGRYGDRFVGIETMRGDGLKFLRTDVGVEDKLFVFQDGFDFFQRASFLRLRVTAKAGFDKLQIFEDQVGPGFIEGEDGVGFKQLVFANDIDLGMGFLVRLDELIGLIEAGVFAIVFAEFDF